MCIKKMIEVDDVIFGTEGDAEDRIALVEILNHHREAVALNISELGKAINIDMEIILKSSEVVRYKPYRLPYGQISILDNIIQELLSNNIIEESKSEYASPIILIKKKEGDYRMCVDYRHINRITKRETFPTPNIEEQINSFTGSSIFNSIDLMSGYYQVNVKEESRHYTAFVTSTGIYQFRRMPFGLTNAPAIFMRLMSTISKQMKPRKCEVYMDDCMIPTTDIKESLTNINFFLSILENNGLTINLKKCIFFASTITFLGYEISEQGCKPGSRKIIAVQEFITPTTVHEVRRFLGLTGYFRKFVQNYAMIAKPLNELLLKDAQFEWSSTCETAFQILKNKLCEEPILMLYDPTAEHELHTDACSVGLAGILFQIQGNRRGVVAYFSRATTKIESQYHSYELEALAVVDSLQRFKYYLLNKNFKVLTDCNSLRYTHRKKDLISRIGRWWLKIQEFNFEIEHRPSNLMAHVDALSRAPVEKIGETEVVCTNQMAIGMNEIDWISTLQREDKLINEILDSLSKTDDLMTSGEKLLKKDYEVKENKLFKKTKDGLRFVVPKGLRWKIIQSYHDDIGHYAVDNTVMLIQKQYWFPRMRNLVSKYIHSCLECLYNQRGIDETRYHIHPIEKQSIPFNTIHVDHVGPFIKSKKQNCFFIGIIDSFTKYVILRAVRTANTIGVVKTLNEISQFFGMPARLISDRGSAFTSKQFATYCHDNDITHIQTAVRTPRANGQIARVFRSLNKSLACLTKDQNGKDWDENICAIQWGLNNITHSITGSSAQNLLFSYKPANMLHNKLSLVLHGYQNNDTDDDLVHVRELVENRIREREHNLAVNFNEKHKAPQTYAEGDLVLIKAEHPATGQSRKLLTRYKGPYKINKVLGNDRYQINDTDTTQVTRKPFSSVFAADKIKPWCQFEDISFNEISSDDDDDEVIES